MSKKYQGGTLGEKLENLDEDVKSARTYSRDTIYKIILISSGIVGFSTTLASLEFLNKKINLQILYYSWVLFLIVIVLGFLILFFEPRIEHAKAWRYFIQHGSVTNEEIKNLGIKQKIKIYWVLLKSILQPENIYFDEIVHNDTERHKKEILSFVLLSKLAKFRQKTLFWGENIFIILFIISLAVFIRSFGF